MKALRHLKRQVFVGLGHAWQNGTFWYLLAGLFLLPVWFSPQWPMQTSVQDTLFVIDVSESMNVQDVHHPRPNTSRLLLAKAAVRESMASLPCGSKVSLGLFAGEEVTVLFEPLEVCRHYHAIEQVISRVNSHMRWIGDSWIVRGLISGIKAAQTRELSLVFVTDADEMPHHISPRTIDLLPFQGKVSGVLWGVGGKSPQPVPKVDGHGNHIAYWTPEEAVMEGNYPNLLAYVKYLGANETAPKGALDEVSEHQSAFNLSLLQGAAQMLKIPYVVLQNAKTGLNSLQATQQKTKALAPRDIRWIFGLLAFVLVLVGWFWQVVKNSTL